MTETKYVAYLRVSTQKQGYSGLGLEAQREIIHNYLRDTTPISEYVEVESGRKSDRPKLKEALSQCRKESATLIVAKLDRLARSVSFLSNLLESDVEIIFCDFPQAKKARGFKLGNPEHLLDKHEQAIQNSIKTCKAKADSNPNNKRAIAMLRTLVKEEYTLQEMADTLNQEGFVTSKGCSFSKSTIYKLLKRYNLK